MSSESDHESGRWSSRSSDSDRTRYDSDDSEDAGFLGEDTDSEALCGGDYLDDVHSDADNVYAGRESDDGDSDGDPMLVKRAYEKHCKFKRTGDMRPYEWIIYG